jgi:hypothetical protein
LPAFFRSTVSLFLQMDPAQLAGSLSASLIKNFSGNHAQQLRAWTTQLEILRTSLSSAINERVQDWGILWEYPLLRLQRRLDVVLLCGQSIVVVEFKVGATSYQSSDLRQVEDYALDLRDFHEASNDRTIIPVLCATEAPPSPILLDDGPGVGSVSRCNKDTIGDLLARLAAKRELPQLDVREWDTSPYRPVPTIIEAAELLYAGHTVSEVAYASSNPENLSATTDRLIEIVSDAQRRNKHIVAFVTGVPGSGKTLAGLNAIHDSRFRGEGRPAGAFLSGNTPLVTVLREALAKDAANRTRKTLDIARREVRTEIQGLMNYLHEYLVAHPEHIPADKVIVFDEAQRAWDAEYGDQKFGRPKSEPALFLEIMERHTDWAVIIALIGGGQEINRGERGLSEWSKALKERNASSEIRWEAVAAPDAITGGDATAWQSLFPDQEKLSWVTTDARLHLSASVRSYRCLATTRWVNALLDGRVEEALRIASDAADFPIFMTRSLDDARCWLLEKARGHRRCGLVASSGARRLRADGLGVMLSANELADVANWYLLPKGDIRSSYALEVAANEYTCQGLEIDYVGICWDGDMLWDQPGGEWIPHKLSGSKWQSVKGDDRRRWAINKYRVLLTRARLGSVIWVPKGCADDPTRNIEKRDTIADVLSAAGARPLS